MIKGVGIDAVSIQRVKTLDRHFLEKVYNARELEQYDSLADAHEDVRAQFLASRFAVKEAYAKAVGTGFCETVVPREIYVEKESSGRPSLVLCGKTLDNAPEGAVSVSITHEEPLAIAIVIIESACASEHSSCTLEKVEEPENGQV